MLNPQKVELMTQIILFEQGEGKESLKLKSYFEKGKRKLPSGIWNAALIYLLILAACYILFGYRFIDFSSNVLTSIIIIAAALVIGVAFIILYIILSTYIFNNKYRNVRSQIEKYNHYKVKLSRLNHEAKVTESPAEE